VQHLVPFIGAAVVILIRLIIGAAGRSSGNQPPAQPQQPRTTRIKTPDAAQIEQERLRRFREAVGLPVDLPTPVQRRNVTRPLASVPPPVATGAPATPGRLRRVQTATPPPITRTIPPVVAQVAPVPVQPAPSPASIAPKFQPYVAPVVAPLGTLNQIPPIVAAPQPAPAMQTGELLTRLRDPTSVRQAIILREILGAPRAFQELGTAWMGPLGLASKSHARTA